MFRLLLSQGSFAWPARGRVYQVDRRWPRTFQERQVLKGPVDDFMDTMGIMSAALGSDCSDCHANAGTDAVKWEADTERKRTARRMTLMVGTINRTNFGGRQVVTCWTCHRGRDIPVTLPPIDLVYGEPIIEADEIIRQSFPGEPTPDQILDKYLEALGGVQRWQAVTSYIATGNERRVPRIRRRRAGSNLRQSADQRARSSSLQKASRQDAVRDSTVAKAGYRHRSPSS